MPKKIITICSPKGGTGKTTIAQNLLVRLSETGKSVIGVDFDPQETLTKWAKRRQNPKFQCVTGHLLNWENALKLDCDVLIIDLPPGVEDYINEIINICSGSNLVISPTSATVSDLDSVAPWVIQLNKREMNVVTVLSRVTPRETTCISARMALNNISDLCPVELRQLSDAHQFAHLGEAASDKPKTKSYSDFEGLYRFVCRKAHID